MIIFNCPHCNQEVRAKDEYGGKEIHCPRCKQMIRIPEPSAEPPKKHSPLPGTARSDIIRFRCPHCDQKIGLDRKFAGKTVVCAQCKTPMRVPGGHSPKTAGTPDALKTQEPEIDFDLFLEPRDSKTTPAGEADISEMLGGELLKDEIPASEAKPPSGDEPLKLASEPVKEVSKVRCPKCGELNPPEAGVCLLCSTELTTAPAKGKVRGPINTKRELGIAFICIMIVAAAAAFMIFSIVPQFKNFKPKEGPLAKEVNQIGGEFVEKLKNRDIEGARKLMIASMQTNVSTNQLDSMSKLINRGRISDMQPGFTSYEAGPEGDKYHLSYNILYEDKSLLFLMLSMSVVNNELKIDGAAGRDSSGGSAMAMVGNTKFEDMSVAFLGNFADILEVAAKSCCAIVVVSIVLSAMIIVSMWVVFEKAGQPGWAAIVPFYNMWVLAEVGELPGWVGLASCLVGFVPYIGVFIGMGLTIYICINVAKAFERGVLFGLGLALLSWIFYPVLAFGSE